jgi:hypothetical protein
VNLNRVFVFAALSTSSLLNVSGCSGGSSSSMCPTNGVILADLRDVERDAEGMVSASFGQFPARAIDAAGWDRARTVDTLLKQTWASSKSKCPGLPAAAVAKVDSALANIDMGLVKGQENQKTVVYNSNAVGLAVPDLFDYFHPDAPKAIVNMDAYFRQLGIDAHFGNFTESKASLDTLKADWTASKATVAAKIATCFRVGGTATVGGEIDASLANSTTALAATPVDAVTVETESDNGALEVDTLELVFDCPALPQGQLPQSGLGSICTDGSTCGTGLECAPYGTLKRCSPAHQLAKIGTACSTTNDCGTDSRSACNTEAGDGYPGGYCFMEPCDDVNVCPTGATCVAIGGETPGCFKECLADTDCRAAEGYVCQLFVSTPPKGFGPSAMACAFPCTRNPDCQSPLTCDIPSGKCKP